MGKVNKSSGLRYGIQAALRKTFPGLYFTGPLREIGSGFRSTALETGNGIVFRIAKSGAVGGGYAKEVQLLPVIRDKLPVPIPEDGEPDNQTLGATRIRWTFVFYSNERLGGTYRLTREAA